MSQQHLQDLSGLPAKPAECWQLARQKGIPVGPMDVVGVVLCSAVAVKRPPSLHTTRSLAVSGRNPGRYTSFLRLASRARLSNAGCCRKSVSSCKRTPCFPSGTRRFSLRKKTSPGDLAIPGLIRFTATTLLLRLPGDAARLPLHQILASLQTHPPSVGERRDRESRV